jgi:stage V sporulation protein S
MHYIYGGSDMEILKVSSHSTPNSVAGAIAGVIREQEAVEVQAVGAGAVNQAIKSVVIARGFLAPVGIELVCIPSFVNITIGGEERTAIKLVCEQR